MSLAGGMLIGASASMLLLLNGKIAGISGIIAGLLAPARGDALWRLAFVAGLIAAGAALAAALPWAFAIGIDRSIGEFAGAGLLVGYGSRLGNGCTSGHGVCGISRGSQRSMAATATFILTGAAAVYVVNHLLTGAR
jgi:uncharacterized membrane protein YedE/YeeE